MAASRRANYTVAPRLDMAYRSRWENLFILGGPRRGLHPDDTGCPAGEPPTPVSGEEILLHGWVPEPPEDVVDEIVVDVDEQHGGREEEEDVPRVEGAQPLVERARYQIERQPPGGDDGDHDAGRPDLVPRETPQSPTLELGRNRKVLKRVKE